MALFLARSPGYNGLRPVFVPSRVESDTGIFFEQQIPGRAGR
jgi:hypothetical protein